MLKMNVMWLVRVYVLECCSVGWARATGKGGSTTEKEFIIHAQHIIVCKVLCALYLLWGGQRPCKEGEETEAQRSEVTHVRSHSNSKAESYLLLASLGFKSLQVF